MQVHDARHPHRQVWHVRLLDFTAPRHQPDHVGAAVNFRLASDTGVIVAGGQHTLCLPPPALHNVAQGIFAGYADPLELGRPIFASYRHYKRFSFSRAYTPAEPPLDLVFMDEVPEVFAHDATHPHTAEPCLVGPVYDLSLDETTHTTSSTTITVEHISPLVLDDTTHAVTTESATVTHVTPLTVSGARHGQTATDAGVTHISTVRANSTTHQHTADEIQPQVFHNLQPVSPRHLHSADTMAVQWAFEVVGDNTTHTQTTTSVTLEVFADVEISSATHYHRATRLNFLPEDWVFRALAEVSPLERFASVAASDRTAYVTEDLRFAVVPSNTKVKTSGG